MARKQTRRSVSLNGVNYKTLKQEASRRGMTITALVELALGTMGIPMIEHPQQSPKLAKISAARRAESVRTRVESRVQGPQLHEGLQG